MNTKIIIALALLLAVFGVSCEKKATEAAKVETPPVNVVAQAPEVGTITNWFRTTADLVSPLETDLSFPTGGRIVEMMVDAGDRVTSGQALARVDTTGLDAQHQAALSGIRAAESQAQAADQGAQAAQSQVDSAQAAFDQAERDFNRMKTLHEEGVATQSEFERAQLGYETAKNGLQAATQGAAASALQAQAAHAGVQASRDSSQQLVKMLEDSTLRAPFSGSISSRDAEIGNVVGPGSPIFGLIGEGDAIDNRLKMQFELPESLVDKVSIGTEITLDVLACGSEISTSVATIGPSIKSDSRTVDYTAYIPSDTPCVLPGMFGNVRIPLEIHENAILLPEEAVIELQEGKFVYVVIGDTAERRQVQTGIRDDSQIEITEGIEPTDQVIVVGNRFLTNGAKIAIQQQQETPAGQTMDQQPGTTGGGN